MCIHFQFIIVSDLNLAIWECPQTSAVDANDAGFQTIAGIECVRLRFTLILAQASCVDSVPLSSFTSMEPRYCEKTNKQTLRRIQTYVRVWLWLLNSRSLPLRWAGRVLHFTVHCHVLYIWHQKSPEIFTFKKLEPGNVWHVWPINANKNCGLLKWLKQFFVFLYSWIICIALMKYTVTCLLDL